MTIAKGNTVGPYEVLEHIGAGGMGDVWRARDRRIGRDVALKVLPEAYAPGDERVLRFEQEARAAGALNHPGLVTIFDVGTMQGSPYIVMELLEGETLRDAIGDPVSAPLSLRKVIDYAIQIASALAVAHEKGIIHRDLKPENIFVTSDGRVKILDFGLAKLASDATDGDGRNRTGRHLTSSGMVVGTPGYMSPEQVRAQMLDHRTDIFSLGAVLYEMISGRRAFDRDSAVETMNAILKDDLQPLVELDPNVPGALDAIVRHCLEKNPRERFQSARDLAFQLRLLLPEFQHSRTDSLAALPAAAAAKKAPYRLVAAIVAALALAGLGVALYRARAGGGAYAVPRTFQQLTFGDGVEMFPTLAPDGKSFAYVSAQSGNRDIYVQRVDGRTAGNITSDSPDDDSQPAFSPDGSQIAFRSEREGGGIFVMGVTGESVRRLTDFGYNPSWSHDGTQLVVANGPVELTPQIRRSNSSQLWLIDAHSGARRLLLETTDAVQPSWSPHGTRIAFWGVSAQGQRDIWTIDPKAPQPKQTLVRLTNDPSLKWNPVWSNDGRYLYFGSDRDGTMNLWRVAIDESSGGALDKAEPLSLPASFSGHFAFAQNGDLAFATVSRSYRLLGFPFDADRGTTGAPRILFGGTQEILTYEPSPDGQLVAFTTGGMQEDVFVANANGTRLRQLTNDAAKDRSVTWAPDGKTLYFYSNRDGSFQIWTIHKDGSGLARVTDPADLRRVVGPAEGKDLYSPNVSPDGLTLAVQTDESDLFVHLDQPLGQRLEKFGSGVKSPRWSPDGKRLAGVSREGIAVYSTATGRFEIVGRGASPQWLPDSKRLVFFDRQNIGVVDVESRRVSTMPFPSLLGATVNSAAARPIVSTDGATLYARQTVELGDIWRAHFEK